MNVLDVTEAHKINQSSRQEREQRKRKFNQSSPWIQDAIRELNNELITEANSIRPGGVHRLSIQCIHLIPSRSITGEDLEFLTDIIIGNCIVSGYSATTTADSTIQISWHDCLSKD